MSGLDDSAAGQAALDAIMAEDPGTASPPASLPAAVPAAPVAAPPPVQPPAPASPPVVEDPSPDPADDLGPAFASNLREREGQAALDAIMAEDAAAPAAAPAAPPSDVTPETPPQAVTPEATAATRSAIADIGRGLTEAPLQVVGGVADAVNETLHLVDSAARWLDAHVADLTPENAPKVELPTTAQADTRTGGIVRGVAQFLTGFVGAGKLLKPVEAVGAVARTAKAMGQGAIADFTVFDPQQARLSNLWQEAGLPPNALTDYLAARPDDGEAEGRLKNAVEGLVSGAALDGVLLAARSVRGVLAAREAAKGVPVEPPRPTVADRDFIILGDPQGELVTTRQRTPGDMVEQAFATTDTGVPAGAAAKGVAAAADSEPRLEDGNFAPVAKPAGALANADPAQVQDLRRRLASGATPEEIDAHPLVQQALERMKQIPETDKAPGYGTDAWKAQRQFRFGDETVTGYDAAIAKLHDGARAFAGGPVATERRAVIVIGPPAAGKSTISEEIARRLKAAIVDPDEAKKVLPEYQDGLGANAVHVESQRLTGQVLISSQRAGENIVLPRVGADAAKVRTLIEALQADGYKVDLVNAAVPADIAYRRMMGRFLDSGRLIEPTYVRDVGERPSAAYMTLRTEGIADGYANLDLAGPRGEPVRILDATPQAEELVRGSGGRLRPDAAGSGGPAPEGAGSRSGSEGSAQAGGVAAQPGAEPGKLFINFARIDAPEDVKRVLDEVTQAMKPEVDQARRGVQTFEQIKLSADQEDAFKALAGRRAGQPLNAEQSLAARQLWASSAEKLAETARLAAENPSEANLFAFRKMLAVHHAVQQEVVAARTETARALASWRIPAGPGPLRMQELQRTLEEAGGPDTARAIAQRVAAMSSAGLVRETDEFVRRSVAARSVDAVREYWVNALLSGPKTHIVNMLSNTSVAFLQMGERAVAARVGKALGSQGGVELGEAMAQWHGLVEGSKDGLRYAWKALRTGESGMGLGKLDGPRQGAISAEAAGLASSGWAGRAVDLLGAVVRSPGRALVAEDELFKTIGYRMELHAQALRRATAEVRGGKVAADRFKARIAELVDSPPEDIRMAAIDQAMYQTFTAAPGTITKTLMRAREKVPFGWLVLPFVSTPANILKFTFERTPLAPLMAQVRGDLAAGGARRELALARMGLGTMVGLTASDLALSGRITGGGPSDPEQRQAWLRAGNQPYSIRVGDRWYAYNRLDPIGSTLGMSADLVELLGSSEYSEERFRDATEVASAVAFSIANSVTSKTYMTGLADLIEAIGEPDRRGEAYFERLAGSFVPAGVAEVARGVDPYMREAQGMLEALKARTPGLSASLPPRRDLWGQPRSRESGLGWAFDAASPVYSRSAEASPIDREFAEQGFEVAQIGRSFTAPGGAVVNLERYPLVFDRYQELAGNALKDPAWGLGAKDLLDRIVAGKHPLSTVYRMRSDGPDGGKEVFVARKISEFREKARAELLTGRLDGLPEPLQRELRRFRLEVREKQEQQQRLKLPAMAR